MTELYDTNGNKIKCVVNQALIRPDAIQVLNRLLDGSYHIQTIGSPAKLIDITCSLDEDAKETIDTYQSTGTPLKVVKDEKYYVGPIIKEPQINITVFGTPERRRYSYQFTIASNEEGIA